MIITLQKYKSMMGISDNSQDSRISALIPVVENDYLAIRNKAFDADDDGNIVYPAGAEGAAARMLAFRLRTLGESGVQAETIGDYSVTYATGDMKAGYPKDITAGIKRYAGVL